MELAFGDVKLIDMAESHQELVRKWRASPEVSAYMYTSPTLSPESQLTWFRGIAADSSKQYWIITLDEAPVGVANLVGIDGANRRATWAFYLGETSTRGRGVGAKVEYLVLSYVFEHLSLNKLCCEVFCFNEAVIKMHQRFGFAVEGVLREHYEKDGKMQDIAALAAFRSDWESNAEEYKAIAAGKKQHA